MYDKELSAEGNAELDRLFLLLVNEYCEAMEQGWPNNSLESHIRANARGFAWGIEYAHNALDHRIPCHAAALQRVMILCHRLYI